MNSLSKPAAARTTTLEERQILLESARITLLRAKIGFNEQTTFFVGQKGVGKTVLLNAICDEAGRQDNETISCVAGCRTSLVELIGPSLNSILLKLSPKDRLNDGHDGIDVLNSWSRQIEHETNAVAVSEKRKSVTLHPHLSLALKSAFDEVARAAKSRFKGVVLFIDAAHNLSKEEWSALAYALHHIGNTRLPLTLFAAGLPQLRRKVFGSKGYSERLFIVRTIGPLPSEVLNPAKKR